MSEQTKRYLSESHDIFKFDYSPLAENIGNLIDKINYHSNEDSLEFDFDVFFEEFNLANGNSRYGTNQNKSFYRPTVIGLSLLQSKMADILNDEIKSGINSIYGYSDSEPSEEKHEKYKEYYIERDNIDEINMDFNINIANKHGYYIESLETFSLNQHADIIEIYDVYRLIQADMLKEIYPKMAEFIEDSNIKNYTIFKDGYQNAWDKSLDSDKSLGFDTHLSKMIQVYIEHKSGVKLDGFDKYDPIEFSFNKDSECIEFSFPQNNGNTMIKIENENDLDNFINYLKQEQKLEVKVQKPKI